MSSGPLPRTAACPAVLLACALLAGTPTSAGAVISRVNVVDGPSSAITATEGAVDAAMAEDGTGGLVYLKHVDGRDHVFAAQFRDGRWGAPQRVDVGQDFDSSWPQIGAGSDGRLVVTWVREFGVDSDRMYSATLDPGADSFQSPVPIDFDVNEATSTFPDLAMARGGQAYLIYNVVTDTSPSYPAGYEGVDVRLARYGNRLWTLLGSPIDRNPAMPMRIPAAAIAPEVGIDIQGGAVIAWQEPDDEFVDRVWARRAFDTRLGIPLQVSPSTWADKPLRGPADAFGLDVSGFGAAAVAFRQQPGHASALNAPRVMVNQLPEVFAEGADEFGKAIIADGEPRGGLGETSIGLDPDGIYLTGFGSGSAALLATGDPFTPGPVEQAGSGTSSAEPSPLVDLAVTGTGAGVAAWRELQGNVGVLGVQERRADGVVRSSELSGPRGGSIGPFALGGSGLGDAIVVFLQGSGVNTQVATATIDAPPDPFLALLPQGWQRKDKIGIRWDPALNAGSDVAYSVSVDDEPVADGIEKLRAKLKRGDVEDGTHRIQVFAADALGQETGSNRGRLRVDRTPPEIELRQRGRKLIVIAFEGRRQTASGLKGTPRVSFGDGSQKSMSLRKGGARARHKFGGSGTYRIAVTARDRAGNVASLERRVRVG